MVEHMVVSEGRDLEQFGKFFKPYTPTPLFFFFSKFRQLSAKIMRQGIVVMRKICGGPPTPIFRVEDV